jgi:hypothetical protein
MILDYQGLAHLLQTINNPWPAAKIPPPRQLSPTKPISTSFEGFFRVAGLPKNILTKLMVLKIRSPNLLEYIENQILDQYLPVGQRADLRYAESQWRKGLIH